MAALESSVRESTATVAERESVVRKAQEAGVRVTWRLNLPSLAVFAAIAAAAPASQDVSGSQRFQYTELHMGVQARIVLYAPREDLADRAARAAFDRIAALDAALSDYRPDSELMRLCDRAGGPPVPVSHDLHAVMAAALDLAQRSDGAFDPTVGPATRLWREARRTGRFPSAESLRSTREIVGWRQVEIVPVPPSIRLARPGMRLDLGGIAKGFALDRAMETLKAEGIASALVEMGGDILVSAPPPGRRGWTVEVVNPAPGRPKEPLVLANQAVSSSGDTEQFVEFDGVRYSHIVDPRTCVGLTTRIAATVVAPTATLSDGLATAVCVLGPARGRALVASTPGARVIVRTVAPETVASPDHVIKAQGWSPPPVTLWPLYQTRVNSPCEQVGYFQMLDEKKLREAAAAGSEIAGANLMWIPTQDPSAPNGCGIDVPPDRPLDVVQRFRATEPFVGIVVQFPTMFERGSATLSLASDDGKTVASRRFESVPNEYQARLQTGPQPAGAYRISVTQPAGRIGVWTTRTSLLPGMELRIGGQARVGWNLEFALLRSDGEVRWLSTPDDHRVVELAPVTWLDAIHRSGQRSLIWVGNWNNGAFPYYPDWFYQRFPDITMRDADDKPISAGMFGVEKGWPAIDHPVINEGTARYIAATVRRHRGERGLLYWALGGEALYPNYIYPWLGWPDYGPYAMAHWRAWLRRKYGTPERLSKAWGQTLTAFESAPAPKEKSVSRAFADWTDFRFDAMARRMQMHWAAVRAEDPRRLALTANHGNVFSGDAWAALGADFPLYADASDGFEMGQIMEGDDPGHLNLWYASALAGLGKVGAPARLAYKLPDPTARGGGRSWTPETVRRFAMEAFGSGWWHLGLIQWAGSLPDGEWGVKGTPAEAEIRRVFSDLRALRPRAEGAWPALPRVGLYLSRYRWSQVGWAPEWTTLHVWMNQRQWDHAVIYDHHLETGEASRFPVLICARNDVLAPEAADGLLRYLRSGGRLIVVGDVASRAPDGRPTPSAQRRILSVPGVQRLPEDIFAALQQMPVALRRAGVRAAIVLESRGEVRRRLSIEPLTGQHDQPIDAAPRRRIAQTFLAPGERILRVGFRTPTYARQAAGFRAILRLRRGGPDGQVLAEAPVPAEQIADNGWTEMRVDVRARHREPLCLELQPEQAIEPQRLGVWASREDRTPDGQAWIDGAPQPYDLEVVVGYEVRIPARNAVEAFALSDGAGLLCPLVNVAGEAATVTLKVDPSLLAAAPGGCTAEDALTGRRLGNAGAVAVTVPAHGYRVIAIEPIVRRADVEHRLRAERQRVERLASAGADVAYQRDCVRRATAAYGAGSHAKAWAFLNRCAASPVLRNCLAVRTPDGGLKVRARVQTPARSPLRGAMGVVRVVPLPGVRVRLAERSPGAYEATIPGASLMSYRYDTRRFEPYPGPFEVQVSLWRGDHMVQASRTLGRDNGSWF